jgi:hypothetical protein
MTYRPDSNHSDFPRTARTRVRLPDQMMPGRIFPGWGPTF